MTEIVCAPTFAAADASVARAVIVCVPPETDFARRLYEHLVL